MNDLVKRQSGRIEWLSGKENRVWKLYLQFLFPISFFLHGLKKGFSFIAALGMDVWISQNGRVKRRSMTANYSHSSLTLDFQIWPIFANFANLPFTISQARGSRESDKSSTFPGMLKKHSQPTNLKYMINIKRIKFNYRGRKTFLLFSFVTLISTKYKLFESKYGPVEI